MGAGVALDLEPDPKDTRRRRGVQLFGQAAGHIALGQLFHNTALEERARIGHLNLLRGDRILIVSDGVSGDLSPRQIRDILTFSDDPDTVARSLIEAAMQAFAADNVTALVVLVEQAEPNLR
ncbi:MAG: hypothetical protein AAFX99_31080 [Myxococcota bacterium]